MVLSNYWKAFKIATICNGNGSYAYADLGMVDIQGTRQTGILYSIPSNKRSYVDSNVKIRNIDEVRVGTGTGQIQPSDYCLFDDITDSISNLSFTITHAALDGKFSSIINVSGINNAESEIVIRELGLTKKFFVNDVGTLTRPIMLAKLILNRPVTVPTNGAFAFTIEWDEA